MIGESGRDDNLIEYREPLFLPRPIRGLSSAEKADVYRRLAVIHKTSIPDKWERVLTRDKAKKELENGNPLTESKDIGGLENEIQEIKQNIRLLLRWIRMFEKSEGENKEKDRFLEEKTFKQGRLKNLEKFISEENIGLENSIQETKQSIQEIETKITLIQKNGYKEKIRLEAEKKSEEKRLKKLEKFLTEVGDIIKWQRSLELSKRAILQSWAFEQDPKKNDWIIKFYSGLKEIEAQ